MPPYYLPRFSERLPWSTPANPFSVLLQEKRQAGTPLLDLTTANPTQALTGYPHQAIAAAYGAISRFRYEPEAFGTRSARQTIADWYAGLGIAIDTQRIALTASTSEAYAVLFKLLCNPGDEILVPCPSYPLFEILARAEGVQSVPYRLRYDGSWFLDFDNLRSAISVRTKAIVVVNPNNPTGSYLKRREAAQLASLAEQHSLAIVSDEVFMTYPAGPRVGEREISLIGQDEVLSFSLNGLSKAAGMPQMKLGWIAVNGPKSAVASALAKLDLLLDAYLSVSTPVQEALPELLRIGSKIKNMIDVRLNTNRAALEELAGTSVEPLPAEGGWSSILQVPNVRSEEEWIRKLLIDEGMIVQPGYFYDMEKEAYLVISLLTDPMDFKEGIRRLLNKG